jgi:rhodanese-related sulfurtransferase
MHATACVLIDVREPREFSSGAVARLTNLPLSRFDAARLPNCGFAAVDASLDLHRLFFRVPAAQEVSFDPKSGSWVT